MDDTGSFGSWLRRRRRSRDLTQIELAERVTCAVGTLRNIEADYARPSKQLAVRLAQALGIPAAAVDAVVAFARGYGPSPAETPAMLPRTPAPDAPAATAAVGSPRADVPTPLTHLIGRSEEVAAVRALLLRPDVRWVTLTGPGGTGKTRVAMEVALQLRDAFNDGVAFVDLSAITDAQLVMTTIAQTLGVPERSRLSSALRDQARLLVLDNFEQVVAATPDVVALLSACRLLKVVITSRIALGAPGEHERVIPPLELPDLARLPPFEQLSQYESVRLFAERARAVNPQFEITSANAPAVAEICYQLDGLPLALELAAARVKLLAPQALLARLDHRLDFLTAGGRVRPSRQQTIRNTIDWSYQLLTPSEQRCFQRFSVFVDGGTLAAIEAVCGANHTPDSVLDDVAALANHSLLQRLPPARDGVDTETDPRFGMLETIRAFAREQLASGAEEPRIRRRHAEYFAALATQLVAAWDTPQINAAIARQRRELDNLRAALQWSLDTGNSTLGLTLALALWGFWRSYGYIAEGRAWLGKLLNLDERPADREAMTVRHRAMHAAAWLASDQHDFAVATSLFAESSRLRQALGDTESTTDLLINAARQARTEGAYQQAAALLESALARHSAADERASGNNPTPGLSFDERGQLVRELGLVLREQGDFGRAQTMMEQALALANAHGDRVSAALALLGLGDIARDRGDGPEVRAQCEPSLALFREFGMQWATGFALNALALGAYAEGDVPRATMLIAESVQHFRELNADASLAEVLLTQGKVLRAQGDVAGAYRAASEAAQHARDGAPRLFLAASLEELASIVVEHGHVELTAGLLAAADALRAQMGAPVRPADQRAVASARARAHATLGDGAFDAAWAAAQTRSPEHILSTLPDAAVFTLR